MGKKRRPKKNSRNSKSDKTLPALNLPIKFEGENEGAGDAEALLSSGSSGEAKPKKRSRLQEALAKEMGDPVEQEKKRRKLLAAAWRERNNIFRSILGKPTYVTPKNYGPPSEEVPDDYLEKMDAREKSREKDTANPGDPTLEEQHLAVLAYGPDPTRPYWTYVTAGLASPWMQSESQEVSGFGCELMIKSPVDLPWVPQLLRTLAFYVFNHAGLLNPGVRISLNNSISQGDKSELRHAFVWYADEVPNDWYQLPSGGFGIFAIVGITDGELEYANSVEEYGTWCIQEILRYAGHGQITDPTRDCVTRKEGIEDALATMKAKADSFREISPVEERSDDIDDFEISI